jgi:hypothetical protein
VQRTWLIYASRFGQARASVAMRWERRGDFARLWSSFADRDGAPRKRPAWRRVRKKNLAWYEALIDELGTRGWLETVRLRLDRLDPDVPLPFSGDLRLVRRRDSAGIQLARLVAKAVGTPVGEMSGAQRHLRQRIAGLLRDANGAI